MTKATLAARIEYFKRLQTHTEKEDFLNQLKQEINAENADDAEAGVRTLRTWVTELHERILEKAG